ncbi:hypothetical protein EZV62_004794 [Acer yangbiense]|uniref:Zinc knuckle CX2CX4HX4C domain-containing protein n=1 Tax=Acer yangbiense TaxID=1000413 RepID=A0A5C7IL95_9ROSI|nr:hypothetical protein EZV62_004794 [Acer yangbiense]
MINSEIAKLYENLSIADEDGVVHEMAEDAQIDGEAEVNHCLVGKVLSGKRVNIEAFRTLIEQLWSPFGAGKFMRVKVQLDIQKPLKRWLCLKLDKSDNIVVVWLRYERLLEFCYACGKIRHGIKECLDTEARNEALAGKTTKFGSWMRASVPETKEQKQKQISSSSAATQLKMTNEPNTKTLAIRSGLGPQVMTGPPSSDPGVGELKPTNGLRKEDVKAHSKQGLITYEPNESLSKKIPSDITASSPTQPVCSDMIISPKKKPNRKWKRLAREGVAQQLPGLISSPIQRVLALGKTGKKTTKGKSISPPGPKISGRIAKVKSPAKNGR